MTALVVVAVGCAGTPARREAGPPRTDAVNLAAIHDAASPAFNRACLDCHADVMTRATLNPRIKNAHAVMVPLMPDFDAKAGVTSANCVSCHTKVDVIQRSGTQIRKNADVSVCEGCHGKNGSAKAFYAN